MKVILTVGYTDILLPSSAGVEQLLKILGRGVTVTDHLYKGELVLGDGPPKIEMKTVPEATRFVGQPGEAAEDVKKWVKKKPLRLNGQRTLLLRDSPEDDSPY